MRTIEVKIYKFSELSEDAKQKAIEKWRENNSGYNSWDGENRETLKAFCDLFKTKFNRNGFSVHSHEINLTGQRLATWLWNNYRDKIYSKKQYWICEGRKKTVGKNSKHRNSKIFLDECGCVLTGFYLDNEILAPVFDFMRKPDNSDLNDIFNRCFAAWENAIEKDIEFQNSDDQIIETIESNEYEFLESGEIA